MSISPNVIRQVKPPAVHADHPGPDISGVGSVRGRMPRWTNKPRLRQGWWAVRFRNNRSRREFVYLDGERDPGVNLEWSDRPYQWPLEQDAPEPEHVEWTRPIITMSPESDDEADDEEYEPTPSRLFWAIVGVAIGSVAVTVLYSVVLVLLMRH